MTRVSQLVHSSQHSGSTYYTYRHLSTYTMPRRDATRIKSDCWKRIEIIQLYADTKELKSAENEFNLFNVRLNQDSTAPSNFSKIRV